MNVGVLAFKASVFLSFGSRQKSLGKKMNARNSLNQQKLHLQSTVHLPPTVVTVSTVIMIYNNYSIHIKIQIFISTYIYNSILIHLDVYHSTERDSSAASPPCGLLGEAVEPSSCRSKLREAAPTRGRFFEK